MAVFYTKCSLDSSVIRLEFYHAIKNDQLVHISDVERGLACKCTCAYCGQRLIAKKGGTRRHHFSHENKDGCAWGIETTLHRAAKEILENARKLWIPEIILQREDGMVLRAKSRYISLDRVTLEPPLQGFVPDVVIEHEGYRLILEIKVTHGVDESKLAKIKSAGISALEIDLSRTDRDVTLTELEPLIVGENRYKYWLHSELATRMKEGPVTRHAHVVRGPRKSDPTWHQNALRKLYEMGSPDVCRVGPDVYEKIPRSANTLFGRRSSAPGSTIDEAKLRFMVGRLIDAVRRHHRQET